MSRHGFAGGGDRRHSASRLVPGRSVARDLASFVAPDTGRGRCGQFTTSSQTISCSLGALTD